jgi:hypothetical protein
MSESITKTLVGALAIAVLFWVFWNPAKETTKAKPKKDKTEQVDKKKKKRKTSGKELSQTIRDAKKRASRKGKKSRAKTLPTTKKMDPPEGSAAFLVTGSVKAVRLRSEDGEMFKPGILPTGRYQILTRGKSGIEEHGHVVFEDGDRQRIDCDDDGCRPWEPTKK